MHRLIRPHRGFLFGVLIPVCVSFHPSLMAGVEDTIAQSNADVITVTAQKREEDIQQVPISITAISGEDLATFGVAQPQDIALFSPGVTSRPTIAHNNPVFSIRGIGFNDFTSIQNPAVAVYVNNVIVPYHTMMGFQLFDMERVEILKGPQGTLYGRNSTAGAINFITHKPVFANEAYGVIDYSSYDTYQLEFMANTPLTEQLAARFAIRSLRRLDSYQKNRLDENSNYGEQDQLDGRLTFLWTPNDDMDMLVGFHSGYDRSGLVTPEHVGTVDANTFQETCASVVAGTRDEGPCINFGGYFDPDSNPFEGDYSVTDDRLDNRSIGASVEINVYLEEFTVTSITGYDSFERYQPQDSDASPFSFIDMLYQDKTHTFSQELRINSENNDQIHWMLGLYYSEDDVDANQSADVSDLLPNSTASAVNDQQSDSTALYGNADLWLNQQWKVFGGLRFTDENKRWKGGSTLAGDENFSSANLNTLDTSGNLGVENHPANDLMWYASFTKSYRSGGFPGGFTLKPEYLEPFDQEDVYAYEIGLKSQFLENTLTINAATYYYDWRDFQSVRSEVIDGQISLHLINVGDAKIFGAEMDLSWQPNYQWELSAGFNLMRTKVVRTKAPELKNNKLANSPELTLNSLVRYHFEVGQIPVILQTDVHYTDKYFLATDNAELFQAKSVWLINGRITAQLPAFGQSESVELALWGKNLADKEYRVGGFSQLGFSGDSFLYYGEPRSIGLSIKISY